MKNLLHFVLFLPFTIAAQVGINTPTPNAALDIESTNNGMLIPRVTLTGTTDIITVVNPAGGALATSTLVYNTAIAGASPNNVIPGFYYWNNLTSRWTPFTAVAGWEVDGNTAITTPAVPATYGTSPIGTTENFIGTTDNNDVTVGTNNIERMRVKSTTGNVGIGTANPTEQLHVYQNSDNNKSNIFSEASQTIAGADFQNIAVKGFGKGFSASLGSNWGYGNGIMGIGDFANSYHATGVYAHLGSTTPFLPASTQALYANGNNLGYAGIFMGGNVGIGLEPTYKLDVITNTNRVANFTNNYVGNTDQYGVYARSVNNPGYGYGGNFEGGYIGLRSNNLGAGYTGTSYGVYSSASGTAGTRIGGYFTAFGGATNYALQAAGTVRINDGTQGAGKVLTSDATGVASWQSIGIENIKADLSAVTGISISYTDSVNFRQTGASITLGPGTYAVNVSMLLSTVPGAYTNSNEAFWVRSTFSDSNGPNPLPSPNIVGSTLVSGNLVPSTLYSLITGMVVINNTTGANKTYYYAAGRVVTNNSTRTIAYFGGNYWAENNIIAYRLN